MPQTRFIQRFKGGTVKPELIDEVPYEVSDEELAKEADEREVRDEIVAKGATILADWDALNQQQVKKVVRALVRYVLWKER